MYKFKNGLTQNEYHMLCEQFSLNDLNKVAKHVYLQHSTAKQNITCNTNTEPVCTATAVTNYYIDSMNMIKMCCCKAAEDVSQRCFIKVLCLDGNLSLTNSYKPPDGKTDF